VQAYKNLRNIPANQGQIYKNTLMQILLIKNHTFETSHVLPTPSSDLGGNIFLLREEEGKH
jgi:hypothetical protein